MSIFYTVVRLLQTFGVIKLPDADPVVLVGSERQTVSPVRSTTDIYTVEPNRRNNIS